MKIIIVGDLHGSSKAIKDFYKRNETNEKICFVCLGDFGGLHDMGSHDESFKKSLSKYDAEFFVIRGNHDRRPSTCMSMNPDKWKFEQYFGNDVYVEKAFPQIKYALDMPAIYYLYDMPTLVLPGAYSVDKYYRLSNNLLWFPEEQMNTQEMNIGRFLVKYYPIDIVLSHTAPICYEPTHLFLDGVDQSLVDKTTERFLGELEYSMKYKLWLWGHYHSTIVYPKTENGGQPIMLYGDKLLDLEETLKQEEVILC